MASTPLRESDLLAHIARRTRGLTAASPHVIVGPGDDCAVLRTGAGALLITVDHLIQGRHFRGPLSSGTPLELVARKAIARSVSDIAAMAGTPTWSLATAALPEDCPPHLATSLFDHMHNSAARWGCPIVGGDIAVVPRGAPLVLTTTVAGVPHATRGPVLRSGARVGDSVWVTGRLGGSLASGRHLTFEPRVREAAALADLLAHHLHAMIDLSDGLGRDAGRVGVASGVTLRIDSARVPLNADGDSPHDGEDHELLFVVDSAATLPGEILGTSLTRIGAVSAAAWSPRGCVMVAADGRETLGDELGWDHTASDAAPVP